MPPYDGKSGERVNGQNHVNTPKQLADAFGFKPNAVPEEMRTINLSNFRLHSNQTSSSFITASN